MDSNDACSKSNEMWLALGEQIAAAIPDIVIADDPAKAIRWAAAAEACFWKSTGEADTHDVKDVLPLFSSPTGQRGAAAMIEFDVVGHARLSDLEIALGQRDALARALENLQSAETTYRMTYDLDGYHHQNTLEARSKLRTAGYHARQALADVGHHATAGERQ